MQVSPMTQLLIERTVGLLMAEKDRQGMHTHFVCVMPFLVGSANRNWVVLTKREFLDGFGPMQTESQILQ